MLFPLHKMVVQLGVRMLLSGILPLREVKRRQLILSRSKLPVTSATISSTINAISIRSMGAHILQNLLRVKARTSRLFFIVFRLPGQETKSTRLHNKNYLNALFQSFKSIRKLASTQIMR